MNVAAISVVIPLYNKERHIARAIQSVLGQTYGDFELIVVNDGSTDRSAEAVRSFNDPRVRLVHREHINSGGGHAARNRGITESHADLIAFLDADDEWLPEYLETITRLTQKHSNCGAYATAYDVMYKEGKRLHHDFHGIPTPPWEGVIPNYFRSATSYPVCSSAVTIPGRVFHSVGLFPVGVPCGGDVEMWCRIALKYRIAFSTQVGAVYHKEADNRICVLNPALNEYTFFRIVQDALSTDVVPPTQRRDALEFIVGLQMNVASNNIMVGNPRYARRLLRSCRSTRRFTRSWRRLMLLTMLPPDWPARLLAARNAMRNLVARRK